MVCMSTGQGLNKSPHAGNFSKNTVSNTTISFFLIMP